MKITEIELVGYKRLALSSIDRIKINITSAYQIIIGTNGSGKSSLLRELTPLPASPSDYRKNGMKRIVIEDQNKTYILTSEFKGKHNHSFVVDGEEKNDGGTITVQRELVFQAFGINQDIHNLFIGKTKFTTLSPTKRRELFTQMSDSDMSFAINLYKKLQGLARDDQGVVKHLRGRLTKETDNLRNLEQSEVTLSDDIDLLQSEITLLMEERKSGLPHPAALLQELDRVSIELDALTESVIRDVDVIDPKYSFSSPEDISNTISSLKGGVDAKKESLNRYIDEYDQVSKYVQMADDVADVGVLETKYREIETRLHELPTDLEFDLSGNYTDLVQHEVQFKSGLVDILTLLADNSEQSYSRSNHEKLLNDLDANQKEINRVINLQTVTERRIQHIETAHETNCPSCGYVWKEGVSEKELDELKLKREKITTYLKKIEEVRKGLLSQKESMDDYFVQFNRFRQFAYNYPRAQELFDWLLEDKRIYSSPSQYIPIVDKFIYCATIATKRDYLQNKLRDLSSAIETAKSIDQIGVENSRQKVESMQDNITQLSEEIKLANVEVSALSDLHRRRLAYEDKVHRFYEHLERLSSLQTNYVDSLRSNLIEELLKRHQVTLALMVQRQNEINNLRGTIDDIRKSLEEVERNHNIHKTLAKAMSPTDGLIARQMINFIEVFVGQVNSIIEQIYTYPLTVKACGIEGGDLDYKFPLVSMDGDGASDILDGSEGQQEIVDFVFRLVAMLYLGFNNHPLYIDEVGRAQDETHLTNVMNYIKLLIESHAYSQLFLISHFAVGFGAFSQADVCVLNGSNITVPLRHNEHVEIDE